MRGHKPVRGRQLEQLRKIERRDFRATKAWQQVETRLGFGLPADYKRLTQRFGPRAFGDIEGGEEVFVLSPFARNKDHNLFEFGDAMLTGYRETWGDDGARFPWSYAREPGGLLLWAITSAGDCLYFLIRGSQPDFYPIVFQQGRSTRCEFWLDLPCTEFLYRVATRQLQSGILPPRQAPGPEGAVYRIG
jgi:hypothetical protein